MNNCKSNKNPTVFNFQYIYIYLLFSKKNEAIRKMSGQRFPWDVCGNKMNYQMRREHAHEMGKLTSHKKL